MIVQLLKEGVMRASRKCPVDFFSEEPASEAGRGDEVFSGLEIFLSWPDAQGQQENCRSFLHTKILVRFTLKKKELFGRAPPWFSFF